ncbi:MAG: ABC transporter ATP-binding protein/permease [Bacteroidetes bacterium]|nr:ABC transporter ATP-binding protein/permease [Bacteroidota bacterium]
MNSLSALNKYFVRYKKELAAGVLFILLSNSSQVFIPLLMRDSIDSLKENVNYSEIIKYALMIVGTAAFSGYFRFLIRMKMNVVSRKIEYDLRTDFWAHIQKLPLRYFQNNSIGNIMAHATNDINAIRMYVGPAVMYSIDTSTKFIFILAMILMISPSLTLFSLLPLPFLSYMVFRLSKRIHQKFTFIQEKFSELTTFAQESFSGIRVIKSYVREAKQIDDFKKLSDEYLARNMDKIKIQALFMPILFLITGVSVIVVIWYGGSLVINGVLTIGEILAFTAYLSLLIFPVIALGWVMNLVQQSSASMKRLNRILDEPYEINDSKDTKYSKNTVSGTIVFKNVSFKYKENLPDVLKNINLEIPKGSTVAFVGHTGVGKSSLINLIPRFYDVTEGQILIDGFDVKEIPLSVLRRNIGLVQQETFLFSDTLRNNILYGLNAENDSVVKKAAEIARLDKDVESFPNGYETILGERGITLSGGQKQRSCLARALAIDPKILILDDSFSAVDTHTEEEILVKLREFMKGRTSIIISHRISTVKDADRIFVLDEGIVVEQGNHEELVANGKIYADLHYRQLLEEELKELS